MRKGRTVIVVGAVCLLQACAATRSNSLVGVWQSDAKATVVEFRKNPKITDRFIEKLLAKDILGKMTYNIEPRRLSISFLGNVTTYEYSVSDVHGTRYVLRLIEPGTGSSVVQDFIVQDDTFKVRTELLGAYEVFRRVK